MSPASSPTPPIVPIAPTPQANPITSAVEATVARGTARLQVDALIADPAPTGRALRGQGAVDMIQGTSDMTWSDDVDPQWQVREIVLQDAAYFSSDGSTWDEVPGGLITPTAELADPLRDLTKATGVILEGTEVINGQNLRRYAMQLPAVAVGFGLTDADRTSLANVLSVSALVWVDEQGRITRILRTLNTQAGAVATTDAQFSAFSEPVTIRSPMSATSG
ncbi:MAG: hypothetical protein KGN78_10560 [Actinomycetales bacterium]|nr:hypothetical protein [Actinomycetales bacterium]